MQIQIAIITFHSMEVMRFLGGIYMSDLAVNLYAENMPKFYFTLWYIFGEHCRLWGESAPSFCRQVAALFPDMFCSFYLAKSHKFAKNTTTTKAREKISTDLESL